MQRDEQESVASLDVLPGYSFTPDSQGDRRLVRRQDLARTGHVPERAGRGGRCAAIRAPTRRAPRRQIPFRVRAQIGLGPKVAFNYKVDDSAGVHR